MASPLDAVGSHRTPSDGAHFEHTQNKHRRSVFARRPNRAQKGHRKVTIAAQLGLLQRNRSSEGAHRAHRGHCANAVQTHWSFVTLHGDCLAFIREFACLVVNQITLDNFAALFNVTPVDRASDSMMART